MNRDPAGTYVQGGHANWTGTMLLCLLWTQRSGFGTYKMLHIFIYSGIGIQLNFLNLHMEIISGMQSRWWWRTSILPFLHERNKSGAQQRILSDVGELKMWFTILYEPLAATPHCYLSKSIPTLWGFLTDVWTRKHKRRGDIILSGGESGGGVWLSGRNASHSSTRPGL